MNKPELTNDQIDRLEQQLSRKEKLRGDPARSFLAVSELSPDAFHTIMATAHDMKASPAKYTDTFLTGKKVALLFQKTSTRTKESFATGIYELGMMSSYIDWRQSNFTLSDLPDEIKVLSQWYDAVMARVYHHEDLLIMKRYSEVPIINGLCDRYHPCQALADAQTIQEFFGENLCNVKLAYIGDGNNVCNSLIEASALAGIGFVSVATPDVAKYRPSETSEVFAGSLTSYEWSSSVEKAVEDANIIYTDTWVSMGQEAETQEREALFSAFRISADVMAKASPHHIFMHALPAHPGKEVEVDVLRGYHSGVFQQAQNRKHAQKALLHYILGSGV